MATVETIRKGFIMTDISKIMYNLTGRGVIDALCEVLREHDAEFVEAERRYTEAVEALRIGLPKDANPSLDEYLEALDKDIISRTVSAGYLGFRVNLENFHHPIGIDFVHLDTIDYLKDHIIGHFDVNDRSSQICDAFTHALPDEFKPLGGLISEYYIFMECAGPKLAHYAGYIIANQLLPWVEPGYREDWSQTLAFEEEMKRYYGYLPL